MLSKVGIINFGPSAVDLPPIAQGAMETLYRELHFQDLLPDNLSRIQQNRAKKLVFVTNQAEITSEFSQLKGRRKSAIVKIIYMLHEHTTEKDTLLDRLKSYIVAFEGLCELEMWDIARELLSAPFDYSQTFHPQHLSTPLSPLLPPNVSESFRHFSEEQTLNLIAFLGRENRLVEEEKIYSKILDKFDLKFKIFAQQRLAFIAYTSGKFNLALARYERPLKLAREIGDTEAIARSLNGLANASRKLSCYTQALNYQQLCLTMVKPLQNPAILSEVLSSFALIYSELNQYKNSLIYSEQALGLAREAGWKILEGHALVPISINSILQNKAKRAIFYAEQANEIFKQIGTKRDRCISLSHLGNCYFKNSDRERAILVYKEALQIAEEIGDRYGQSLINETLGAAYLKKTDYTTATVYLENSERISRGIFYPQFRATIYHNLSYSLACLKQFHRARRYAWKALSITRKYPNNWNKGYALLVFAHVEWHTGKRWKAIKLVAYAGFWLFQFRNSNDIRYAVSIVFKTIFSAFKFCK